MSDLEQMEHSLRESLGTTFGDLRFSVSGLLERAAAEAPDHPALLAPGRVSLTYRGLSEQTRQTVGTLNGLGFTPRSRIALALPNSVEAAAAYICLMAGMTILPVSPDLPAGEYERYLRHARADAVLVMPQATPGAREAAARLGIPALELAVTPHGPAGRFAIVGAGTFTAGAPQFAQRDDTAVVLPTSGTTSLPKLVPRTQREIALAAYLGYELFHLPHGPHTICGLLPLYLVSGFNPLLRSLVGQVGFACPPAVDVNQVYRYLALYRPAVLLAVPALLQALVDAAPAHGEEIKQFALQQITVVSAALPEPLLREAQRVFRVPVQILYGMTEMNWIASITRGGPGPADRPGSVGRPFPFCEVRISAEDGTALPAGASGKILVRSPLVFAGYEQDPEANAAAFHAEWFRTGDAGRCDGDGYLYLTGRVKEMINRGGRKVAPSEVDAVLLEHPAVADAATFGFPHAALGEDVAVAVVLRDPGVTERELRRFAAARLATYKVPSRFVFVSAIPRTALGKIQRAALAAQFKSTLSR